MLISGKPEISGEREKQQPCVSGPYLANLPGDPPRDPADRIIVATARDLGATLITRDRALLDYGEQGHVNVVEC